MVCAMLPARAVVSAAAPPRRCVAARASPAPTHTPSALRPGESAEEAARRRERESARVEERTKLLTSREELDAAFALASPDELVILSIESDRECNLDGLSWAPAVASSNDAQAPCRALRESLQRVARDCANVAFLTLDGDAGAEARKLAVELGATSFPTVQYYKNGRLLFQSVGAGAASAGLGAGASLFLADSSTSEYVADVADEAALRAFIDTCASPQPGVRGMTLAAPCEKQIAVLDVSRADSPACMHVFPAVLALAKNTAGVIRWGRLLADGGGGAAQLAAKLKVTSTPTFVFFDSTGAEVGRYAGADRGALMAAVLETQSAVGYTLPDPPPRKRPSTAEAKKIAAAAREREKAAGRKSGW